MHCKFLVFECERCQKEERVPTSRNEASDGPDGWGTISWTLKAFETNAPYVTSDGMGDISGMWHTRHGIGGEMWLCLDCSTEAAKALGHILHGSKKAAERREEEIAKAFWERDKFQGLWKGVKDLVLALNGGRTSTGYAPSVSNEAWRLAQLVSGLEDKDAP